jgi:hypothetical protein
MVSRRLRCGSENPAVFRGGYYQFAISVTDVPEQGVLSLSGLGGLAFLWYRRKSKAA